MRTESFTCDGPYCIECGGCLLCSGDCPQSADGQHVAPTLEGAGA